MNFGRNAELPYNYGYCGGCHELAIILRRRSADSASRRGVLFLSGSSWDGLGVNFALFSANATKVELCLFDAGGLTEVERIELPGYTDEIWHGYLPDIRPGQVYGYECTALTILRMGTGSTRTSCC